MKIKKLVAKAESYLDSDERKLKEKIKCVNHVLKKLRKREDKLKKKTEARKGDKDAIQMEINLIHAQRKKGVSKLKEYKALKQEKKTKKAEKAAGEKKA